MKDWFVSALNAKARQEKISRAEVLGPFICCFLASIVFFSDVFLYIVERACAWMVWDEFAELEEKVRPIT